MPVRVPYSADRGRCTGFMKRSCRAVIAMMCLATAAQGLQAPESPRVAFEVASIRPQEWSMDCHTTIPSGGTHFGVGCRSLLELIAMAWHIKGDDIQGGDRSALAALYNVTATLPENKTWSNFDTIRPMLQQLLIDRFHLAFHFSSRKQSGYGLFIGKEGVKLKPAERSAYQRGERGGDQPSNWISTSHIQGRGENMSQVATLLSLVLREPVVDHTGLSGVYNVDLDFAPIDSTDSTLPSFFSAVEDGLGLKLHPEQVITPILVIDHIDGRPTPN